MKRILLSLLCLATIVPATYSAGQTSRWQQIPIPQLPAFKPQQPKRIQLSNGMVIFLQEDH